MSLGSSGPEAQNELTVEQLASVHALLGPERATTFHDILITAALEALSGGPLTESELVADALRMWPGTGVDAVRINAAMKVAASAGYVGEMRHNGQVKWTLTKLGVSEVTAARDWARDILEETARQVQAQLAHAGRNVSMHDARLWATALRQALMAGIAGSFAPYFGEVDANGRVLTVRRWNRDAIHEVIARTAGGPEDADLMRALAIDAFDPLTPFGNELVTAITVGYMLHAFVGRRDRVAARAVVGSLNGVRAILDTPILLRLLGAAEIAGPVKRVIAGALAAGMEVVAPIHYLEELRELIASVEAEHLPMVQRELSAGIDVGALGTLVDDQVLSLWLRAAATGRYRGWSDFRSTAEGLHAELEGLGVIVRPHHNTDADNVALFERALAEEVLRAGSHRKKAAIERDGQTMAMAHRKRSRTERAFWPGAWIITIDTRVGPAYAGLQPRDAFSLALTPAAWVSVISNCSEPAEVEKLAAAASQLFGEEGFMTVAARFPVRTAVEIARALSPANGGSLLDVRVAQGIDELLRAQPDYDAADDHLGPRLAAEVVARRAERMNHTFTASSAQQVERTERMAAALAATQRRAEEKDAEAQSLATRLATAEADAAKARGEVKDVRVLERRRTTAILVGVVFAAVFAYFLLSQLWIPALVAALALLYFGYQASEWISQRDMSWMRMLFAVAADVIAVVIGLVQR